MSLDEEGVEKYLSSSGSRKWTNKFLKKEWLNVNEFISYKKILKSKQKLA